MLSRLRFFVPFALALICLTFVGVLFASAADAPANTRPATVADLPLMSIAGIQNPQVGMAWNPSDPNTGQAAAEAKQWLAQHATKGSNISCMRAEFAQKLKNFMEAVPGGPPTISDGYRAPGKQTALVASGASKAGPCQSYHNYGLAADFNQNRNLLPWMHANAGRHGLKTITPVDDWDPGHFQDANGISGQCGACANDTGNGTVPDTGAPGSGPKSLSDQIRQALGQQPPPPPPQQQPPQSQPTTPSTQQQTPVSNLLSIPTSTSAVSTNINVNQNTNATSTLDLIEEFLNPVSDSITIGTAVDIDLNPDTRDAISLNGKKPTSTLNATGTLAIYQTLSVPQTFTSNDLANNPVSGYFSGENTFIWKILETMKNTLLLALSYLRPFGGFTQTQVSAE